MSHRYRIRLMKLWRGLTVANYRRGLRYGVAASIEHDAISLPREFDLVLDAGANRGQFALWAKHQFPKARILCFEPLRSAQRTLSLLSQADPRIEVFPRALSNFVGEATLHVSSAADSSSLLPIGPRQAAEFPGTQEASIETVSATRLDEVLEPHDLEGMVLLKVDVQGGELALLQGAEESLAKIDFVLIEASFVELYAGQPTANDVWQFLAQRGFACRGVWSVTYGREGECLQADFLFSSLPRRP